MWPQCPYSIIIFQLADLESMYLDYIFKEALEEGGVEFDNRISYFRFKRKIIEIGFLKKF